MNEVRICLPSGWECHGVLPDVEPDTMTEEDLEALTEDVVQVCSPRRDFCVDVSWLPEGDRSGRFVGQVIVNDDWTVPLETMETRSVQALVRWMHDAVESSHLWTGEAAIFSDEIIVSIVAVSTPPSNLSWLHAGVPEVTPAGIPGLPPPHVIDQTCRDSIIS